MADRKALTDETPEDVATLYSWANLHGAKYRDFSASRAQTREKARQRVQEAIETERRRAREEAEALKTADAQKAADVAIKAEAARKQEQAVKEQAQRAESQPAQPAAPQRVWQPAGPPPPTPVAPSYPTPPAQQPEYAYAQPQAYAQPAPMPAYPQAAAQPAYAQPAPQPVYSQPMAQPPYPQPPSQMAYPQAPIQPPPAPVRDEVYRGREDHYLQVRNAWAPAESREPVARPAWLSSDRADVPVQPVPQAPEDTLQASRDRLTSRWFALNGVFAGATAPAEAVPAPAPQRAPVLAVFSLAGGVGKTSLVATLGRALSARGERVSAGGHRGLRPASVFLWSARSAARRPAHLYGSRGKQRRSDPDDYDGPRDARSGNRARRKHSPRKSRAMPAEPAGCWSTWLRPPAPPPAGCCAWPPLCSCPWCRI